MTLEGVLLWGVLALSICALAFLVLLLCGALDRMVDAITSYLDPTS